MIPSAGNGFAVGLGVRPADGDDDPDQQRHDRDPVPAAGVAVDAVGPVEVRELEVRAADPPVVGDQDAGDGAGGAAVGAQPRADVLVGIGQQVPRA